MQVRSLTGMAESRWVGTHPMHSGAGRTKPRAAVCVGSRTARHSANATQVGPPTARHSANPRRLGQAQRGPTSQRSRSPRRSFVRTGVESRWVETHPMHSGTGRNKPSAAACVGPRTARHSAKPRRLGQAQRGPTSQPSRSPRRSAVRTGVENRWVKTHPMHGAGRNEPGAAACVGSSAACPATLQEAARARTHPQTPGSDRRAAADTVQHRAHHHQRGSTRHRLRPAVRRADCRRGRVRCRRHRSSAAGD